MKLPFSFGRFSRLARDQRGNVIMIMGFALVPLIFTTGMVIDYSRAARMQTKLNALTDAASLVAVAMPMMERPYQAACNAARDTFRNQLNDMKGITFNNADLKIVIAETYASKADATITCPATNVTVPTGETLPLSRNVTVSYDAKSPNIFGGILNKANIAIGGEAISRTAVAPYIDIHMALDTSQSMGLAATNDDAIDLYDLTEKTNGPGRGCTFGCHVFQEAVKDYNVAQRSNEALAETAGIRLRINSLRDAAAEMIQIAMDAQKTDKLYRFGLYRIGASTSTISALTNELTTAKTTIQGLKLGPNDSSGYGDTHFPDMAKTMLNTITVHGDGTTQDKATAFLFIVTDGVMDIKTSGSTFNFDGKNISCSMFNWNHCTGPINPDDCQKIKENNVTVGVVYTTYLPVKSNPKDENSTAMRGEYNGLVKNFASDIAPKLRRCASGDQWFLEASDGPGIEVAMKKLMQQALEAPRLIK